MVCGTVCAECYEHDGRQYHLLKARIAWVLASLDGPMRVIADMQGVLCYGRCWQDPDSRKPRYYWLYDLTIDERILERKLHAVNVLRYGATDRCKKEICGHDPEKKRSWKDRIRAVFSSSPSAPGLYERSHGYERRTPIGFFVMPEHLCAFCAQRPAPWRPGPGKRQCDPCARGGHRVHVVP